MLSPLWKPKPLKSRHRDAMLNLILEWAKIEGSLGWFLSILHGFDPAEGALLISSMKPGQILADARKAIRQMPGGEHAARTIKKIKVTYESYAPIRNRIAHSCCIGCDEHNEDLIIFLIFSAEENKLVSEADNIDTIIAATEFAKHLNDYLWAVSNRIEEMRRPPS